MRTTISDEINVRLVDAAREGLCLMSGDACTNRALRRREQIGEIMSPFDDMYVSGEYWRTLRPADRVLHVIRALARSHPDWVFCFSSAALVHGLDVSNGLAGEIHVVSLHSRRFSDVLRMTADGKIRRIVRHAFSLRDEDVVQVGGVNVTSVPRTLFDCVRHLSFPLGLGIADSGLRTYSLDRDELICQARDVWKGCRGSYRYATVMKFANALSENGGESYARAIMLENGVMEPELQVEYADKLHPGRVFRIDYRWRVRLGRDVGGELDGIEKSENEEMLKGRTALEAFRREREREAALSIDLKIARFTFDDARKVAPLINTLDLYEVPRGVPRGDLSVLRDASARGDAGNPYALVR